MASPFHAFRKHQRLLLVVVGVICIITFTVGDFILSYFPMGGGGNAEAKTVATWKGGELNENELYSLRRAHGLTIDYLAKVAAVTVERGGSPKGAGVNRDRTGRILEPGISTDASDLRLVRTLLLAEQAEKIGMELPDEAIVDFLAQLSDRMLSSDELRSILTDATGGRLTRDQLFDHLRRELLARNYLRLVVSGDVMTPDDAWGYYNRLTRRVTTSMLAFPAEKYLDRAPQPSKTEIEAFYDKYKEQYPNPGSPEPGFKQLPQYKFAYFKADYDKFIEEEKAKIPAEAVQKHYDENKETYRVPELPPANPDVDQATTSEIDESQAPDLTAPETPRAPEKATPPSPDVEPEAPTDEPNPTDEPTPPATEEGDKSDPSGEANAPASDSEQAPAANEGAGLKYGSPFFVAFQADDEAAKPDSQEEPATPAPTADSPTDPAAEQPAAPAEAPGADEAANEKAADETGPAAPTEAEKAEPAEAAEKKEPKYQPLSEVEDDIRRTLASQAARERMDKALSDARRQIDRYKRANASYRARIEAGGEAKEPEKPDFKQIAADLGLEYGETPTVDQLNVGETELGQTFIFGPGFQQYSFAQIAMGEQATLYQPQRIQGMSDYLYWAVEFQESRTPPLDEIRAEVVRAWQLQKAFEIATQEAAKAAEKVREASTETPLAEILGVKETEVIQPPAFSWMTQGATAMGGGAPFISDVQGVESPGHEFMQAVFDLPQGGAGVAPNESKTIAYLVRLEDETPSAEIRRDLFLQQGIQFNVNLQYVAQLEQQRKIFAWLEEFEKDWALEWKRPPQNYAS